MHAWGLLFCKHTYKAHIAQSMSISLALFFDLIKSPALCVKGMLNLLCHTNGNTDLSYQFGFISIKVDR